MRSIRLFVMFLSIGCASKSSTAPGSTTPSATEPAASGGYSCYSYSRNDEKHAGCDATAKCAALREETAKDTNNSEVGECASVASVWCYHKSDFGGDDVCFANDADCQQNRTFVMKNDLSKVDSECAEKR